MSDNLLLCSVISHSTLAAHQFRYRTGACMFGYTKTIHPGCSHHSIPILVVNREQKKFSFYSVCLCSHGSCLENFSILNMIVADAVMRSTIKFSYARVSQIFFYLSQTLFAKKCQDGNHLYEMNLMLDKYRHILSITVSEPLNKEKYFNEYLLFKTIYLHYA